MTQWRFFTNRKIRFINENWNSGNVKNTTNRGQSRILRHLQGLSFQKKINYNTWCNWYLVIPRHSTINQWSNWFLVFCISQTYDDGGHFLVTSCPQTIFHSAGKSWKKYMNQFFILQVGFLKQQDIFFPVVTINYFYIIVAAVEYWVIIIKVEKMYINTFCVMFCLFFQEDKWFLHKSLLSFKSNICNINKCCFLAKNSSLF